MVIANSVVMKTTAVSKRKKFRLRSLPIIHDTRTQKGVTNIAI